MRTVCLPCSECHETDGRCTGSGIAPFLPIPTEPAGIALPFHIFLFVFRVPLLLTVALCYFLLLQWLPIGPLARKAALWVILGVPGIWWVDLQIDGVKKGYGHSTSASPRKTIDRRTVPWPKMLVAFLVRAPSSPHRVRPRLMRSTSQPFSIQFSQPHIHLPV